MAKRVLTIRRDMATHLNKQMRSVRPRWLWHWREQSDGYRRLVGKELGTHLLPWPRNREML